MLRKILVLTVAIVALFFSANGCKKTNSPESETESVKTAAEYEAEATKDINEENMEQELDRLEQELQREAEQIQ